MVGIIFFLFAFVSLIIDIIFYIKTKKYLKQLNKKIVRGKICDIK